MNPTRLKYQKIFGFDFNPDWQVDDIGMETHLNQFAPQKSEKQKGGGEYLWILLLILPLIDYLIVGAILFVAIKYFLED